MRSHLLCVIVSALALTACAKNWNKPGSTEIEFRRDVYACQREAGSMYPPNQVVTSGPVQGQSETNCTKNSIGQLNCKTTPGLVYAPAVTMDANALAYSQSVDSCLMARGYSR